MSQTSKLSVQCPAHDDSHSSLVIQSGRNGLLFHCLAGCATADIVQAIARSAGWVADYGTENEKGGRIKFSFFNMTETEARILAERITASLEG